MTIGDTAPRHLCRLSLDGWNTDDGVIEWFATLTPRDFAKFGRTEEAARYGLVLDDQTMLLN